MTMLQWLETPEEWLIYRTITFYLVCTAPSFPPIYVSRFLQRLHSMVYTEDYRPRCKVQHLQQGPFSSQFGASVPALGKSVCFPSPVGYIGKPEMALDFAGLGPDRCSPRRAGRFGTTEREPPKGMVHPKPGQERNHCLRLMSLAAGLATGTRSPGLRLRDKS
jgi:hypothetical protein